MRDLRGILGEVTVLNDMVKNLLLWLVIAAVLLSVFNNFNMKSQSEQVGYSEFIQEIQSDQVKRVVVDGLTISGERYDGTNFETIRPMVEDPKLIDDLLEHKVVVEGPQTRTAKCLEPVAGCQLPHPDHYRRVHVFHAPDAGRCGRPRRPDELWQEQGAPAG